ncbi:MAG TPA: hypothetical protein VGO91_05275 [Pyrinomonadaceae bacterium]|jgi:hypothetical protein|nr:hypothetical protein [Pyrinomonadaceae bacterium]
MRTEKSGGLFVEAHMKINLKTIALALALPISCLFPARAARAGNSLSLGPHDAASSSVAQASRASKRRRHSRPGRKSARRSLRHSSASQPAQPSPATSTNAQPNTGTDIQPSTRDIEDDNNNSRPRPTPTPSMEPQFPKTYKIKKP